MIHIPAYERFLSTGLREALLRDARPVTGVAGLMEVGPGGGLETTAALRFLCELYEELRHPLNQVLNQRATDRKFIDERVRAMAQFNREYKRDLLDDDYQTPIGLEDGQGRVVIGPLRPDFASRGGAPVAPIPSYLQGPHVTLFGPPDSAKLSINAMNAYHRQLPGEPAIVRQLLATHESLPKWGADDEDSKTPLRQDLIAAGVNLSGCFAGTLRETDKGKTYELASDKRSLPIKRFPGLAMPCSFLFYQGNPLPLHLYDFALHLFQNWANPAALTFYVPKLENEEEARYIRLMMEVAEKKIQALHPSYALGTIRLMIVLENPRAILRTHEIMDELYPYFAGASLGWHDYLASTARLFKEDPHYRIPVKADPNIVIKYIKASHNLLADVVGPRGGIKVGGMYGILPISTDLSSESFQITLKGYIKDVVTQMKRNLTGFWVAHPDFVRLGLALVEAWKFHAKGDSSALDTLVKELLHDKHHQEILGFIHGPDIEGLNKEHPRFVRSLIVADIKESTFIANNHPDEIRYNVFQALQYLADWLAGNGCVALPAQVEQTPVRVMDDLATAERSRWEVWHELYHGRFALTEFLKIAFEEMNFIRRDLSDGKKIVQVKWDERTEKWYPIALRLMVQLMTDKNPVEFATELLLPFTVSSLRSQPDPWASVTKMDPQKYQLAPFVERFMYYFERCGSVSFATEVAQHLVQNNVAVRNLILKFTKDQIIEAASFHGDIGGGQKTLDHMARGEQALVFNEDDQTKRELAQLGEEYLRKFGVKFLVSAQGKTGKELLTILKERLPRSEAQELDAAREALSQITLKRLVADPHDAVLEKLEALRVKHKVTAAQVSVMDGGHQVIHLGGAQGPSMFQVASLSKTVASAFALEFFRERKIPLTTKVNALLATTQSSFRLEGAHADEVTLEQLANHTALNMHYVAGVAADQPMPPLAHWLKDVRVQNPPGEKFQYSGGGFLVLEHLLTQLTGKSVGELTRPFLDKLALRDFDFVAPQHNVEGTVFHFPAFAAGAVAHARDMHLFLASLTEAFQNPYASGPITHDTARLMLHGFDKGCMEFMGCLMGIGVFIAEAGDNRFMIHQGANDGFRAIYLHCFQGPDTGRGLVILARGDNEAMLFAAEATQVLLNEMKLHGVDRSQFQSGFSTAGLKQEEIVNVGYRDLVFKAFAQTLPPEITDKGPKDPLAELNLAHGGTVLWVSNQRFARAENLLSDHLPKFDPELFCYQGKVMDSWETVRHNPRPSDTLLFRLKRKSHIRYVSFSTKYHHGNQPESVMLWGRSDNSDWQVIVPRTGLAGHALKCIALPEATPLLGEIKVEMFPDGGLTRLGLYESLPPEQAGRFRPLELAQSVVFSDPIPQVKKPLSLPFRPEASAVEKQLRLLRAGEEWNAASSAYGAKILKATNEHYSPAAQLISPFAPLSMFDGMESARSRRPGNFEEVIVQLAQPCVLHRLELDYSYFVNNNPLEVSIDGLVGGEWVALVPRQRVKAYAGNTQIVTLDSSQPMEQLRVRTYPDGGMNRLRAWSKR